MKQKDNHYTAFNEKWFEKNQWIILFVFRIIYKIFPSLFFKSEETKDFGNKKIVKVGTNYATCLVDREKREFKTVFFTDWNYSKMLYNAFKPMWWAMHYWDELVADRFVPRLSFGFSTLTANSQTGGGGANVTTDGEADRSAAQDTFGNLRVGAGTNASTGDFSQGPYLIAGTTSDRYTDLLRFGETFDTSSIGSDATISSAVLSLYYNSKSNGLGSPEIDIVDFTPANNNDVVSGDYANFGTTPFASITYANWTAAQFNAFTLDANGIANINKTGVSGFGETLNWDTDNNMTGTWANGASSQISFLCAEIGANKPKLVVIYSLPSGGEAGLLLRNCQ